LVFINQELLIIEKGILKTDEQAQVFVNRIASYLFKI